MSTERAQRFWRWLFVASALVNAAPLWSAKYLPFTDLPEHVAAAATLRHWFDPTWHDRETYVLAFGKSQYLAYHVLVALVDGVCGDPDRANRIVLTAAAIALPFAMRALLRAYQTDDRIALFACPLFWCRPLVIGFLPYMAALPVLVYALALVVRQLRAPTKRRAIALALLSVLVFYLHVSAYAVLALVSLAIGALPPIATPAKVSQRLASFVWLAPSLVALVAWLFASDKEGGPTLLLTDGAVSYVPQAKLGIMFAAWTHDVWVSHVDEVLAVGFWLVFVWLGAQRGVPEPGGARAVAARFVPFSCVLLLYVVVPFKVGAGAMLNVRLGVLLALFLLLVLRPNPGGSSRWAFVAVAAISVAGAINAALQIHGSQSELGDLDAVFAQIRPGSRVLALHFERESAFTHSAPWVHVLAHHRARHGGVASVSFSEMSHWPIHYRSDTRPPRKNVMFWDFEPCLFRNREDGPFYDFIVTRGGPDLFTSDTPGPKWRELTKVGRFRVYERAEPRGDRPSDVDERAARDETTIEDPGPCKR